MPALTYDLLPPHSTPAERALARLERDAMRRLIDAVPTFRDADRCPEFLLPYLAWELSVDEWDDRWDEATKRNVCRASLQVHRRKGTLPSLVQACQAIYPSASVLEWPAYGGTRGTIRLEISEVRGRAAYEALLRVVGHTKPVFIHLDRIGITNALTLHPRVGVAGRAIAHQVQPWRARPGEAALPQVHLAAAGRAIAHQVQLYRPRPLTAEAAGGAATAVLITQTISAEAT